LFRLLPLVLAAAGIAHAACPAPAPTVLLERFLSGDCEACWGSGAAPEGAVLVLDWIVPSARGDEAPLSAAAVPEAAARAGTVAQDRTLQRRQPLPAQPNLRLKVLDGPAWNGYIGLQLSVERLAGTLPRGAVGYLALVENVPAGTEGTPIARQLVRSVVGPLPLDAGGPKRIDHLRALRIPLGSKPARLTAVGWIEAPAGKVIAAAQVIPEDCAPAR